DVLEVVTDKSTRKAVEDLNTTFDLKVERKERVILDEKILNKMDKLKEKYQVESSYELIDILLEEKLKTPSVPKSKSSTVVAANKKSRYIPAAVKRETYTGQCSNCKSRRNLEYDHR